MWAWGEGKVEVVELKWLGRALEDTHTLQASTPHGWTDLWMSERKTEDSPLDRYTTLVQRHLHGPGFIPFLIMTL